MVLKTGPDRPVGPVQPPTGQLSGSVRLNEPFYGWTGIEPFKPPVEPPNRTNHPVFHKPVKPFFYKNLFNIKKPIIHWAHSTPITIETQINYKPIVGLNNWAQTNKTLAS